LFFINGNVFTPALTNNILPGITRSILIDALLDKGIKVLEGDFNYLNFKKQHLLGLQAPLKEWLQ
jgi:branched-subunit amino acid aminotransferase/4-amino-4-deoxychorismate lyase